MQDAKRIFSDKLVENIAISGEVTSKNVKTVSQTLKNLIETSTLLSMRNNFANLTHSASGEIIELTNGEVLFIYKNGINNLFAALSNYSDEIYLSGLKEMIESAPGRLSKSPFISNKFTLKQYEAAEKSLKSLSKTKFFKAVINDCVNLIYRASQKAIAIDLSKMVVKSLK